jgi:twitching motility protein PilT
MVMSAGRSAEWSRRLGEALVTGNFVNSTDLPQLLQEASGANVSLGELVTARGMVPAATVLNLLGQIAGLHAVDLSREPPSQDAVGQVPEVVSREYGVVGYRLVNGRLAVAAKDPLDPADLRAISGMVGMDVFQVLADPTQLHQLQDMVYGASGGQAPTMQMPGVPPSPGFGPEPTQPPGFVTPQVSNGMSEQAPVSGFQQVSSPPPSQVPGAPLVDQPVGASPFESSGGFSSAASSVPGSTATAPAPGGLGQMLGAYEDSEEEEEDEEFEVGLHIDDLLRYAVKVGASDLHLTAQMPPCVRVNGAIRPIEGLDRLDNRMIRDMVFGILPQIERERFEEEKELDTSHSIAGVGRFRVNVFMQRGTVAAALRPIPHEIPTFGSLGLPEAVRSFADLRRGLVLFTGPTGSGKSTSLAALVDIINSTKPLHIVTVEDPIEFLHNHKRAIINQREVGHDTYSFAESLRRVLRQDPDVILVGEMRDLETISTALTAAETGHLVFATLHTQDAPQTVDRIIDVFPVNQQDQIRVQLAASLEGVVTQQLVLKADGSGRVVCCEVMIGTSAIRNLIRASKTHQIYSLMQTGASYGMQTMDQGLASLVKQGIITEGAAFDRCRNEEDLRNHLNAGF